MMSKNQIITPKSNIFEMSKLAIKKRRRYLKMMIAKILSVSSVKAKLVALLSEIILYHKELAQFEIILNLIYLKLKLFNYISKI
jgi:hypothetical protein